MSGPGVASTTPAPTNDLEGVADMSHRTCSVPGCARPAKARLLCSKHYQRAMAGKADLPPRITTADRFWEKVDKNGPVPDFAPHLGPCWPPDL